MILLPTHINHVVDAPMLDAFRLATVVRPPHDDVGLEEMSVEEDVYHAPAGGFPEVPIDPDQEEKEEELDTVEEIVKIKYYAYLEDKETKVKTAYVEGFVSKIDEDKEDSDDVDEMNSNYCVHFKFLACNQVDAISGQPGNGLDIFEDRAKLNLFIFNENHEECWWSKSPAYRVLKTQITHVQ